MIAEAIVIGTLVASGSSLLLLLSFSRLSEHLAFAVPAGAALVSAVSLVLLVLPTRYSAMQVLIVLALVAAGCLVAWLLREGAVARRAILTTVLPVTGLSVALVPVLRLARLTRVTADSFEYLQSGGVIEAVGGLYDDAFLMVNRQLVLPVLHNLASVGDEWFLVSLTPLFMLSFIATIWWLARFGSSSPHLPDIPILLVVAVVAVLLTTNRVIFHAFYVNAHLMVGLYLLQVAALGWMIAMKRVGPLASVLIALLLVPLLIARPEAPLLGLLALVALSVLPLPRGTLVVPAGAFVAVTALWWAIGLGPLAGWSVTSPVVVACGAALGVIVVAIISDRGPWVPRYRQLAIVASHTSIWLALVGCVVLWGSDILTESLLITFQNLTGPGLWGALPAVLLISLPLALLRRRLPGAQAFLLPILTFLPLMLVLTYLRGGPYRLGTGDSLNRGWMHIVPLAVGCLVLAICSTRSDDEADGGGRPGRGRSMVAQLGSSRP